MDLVGSESRKSGTRGGRADFTWESVKDDERQYYLGNSIAKPLNSLRNAGQPEIDWYSKPKAHPPSELPRLTSAGASASNSVIPERSTLCEANNGKSENDLDAVRRRERAIMGRMIVGKSFSDAVRSALSDSAGSGVDDEGSRDATTAAAAERHAVRRREKTEKAQRKEARRRIRELRRMKQAEKHRRWDKHHTAQYSSESERESIHSRMQEDAGRRRRRREKDSARGKKRSGWTSTSDSDDPDRHRLRRQRLR